MLGLSNTVSIHHQQKPCLALAWCVLCSACASNIPLEIRTPVQAPPEAQIRADIKAYISTRVRWGGAIVRIENKPTETWIEVVSRRLYQSGRPRSDDYSVGRFIARIQGFLEPEIFAQGRSLTVVGSIQGQKRRAIGEYQAQMPVLKVASYYLWEDLPDILYDDYYYWYLYDYPYHRYPHYPHARRRYWYPR